MNIAVKYIGLDALMAEFRIVYSPVTSPQEKHRPRRSGIRKITDVFFAMLIAKFP
jgi:hypothetical protein